MDFNFVWKAVIIVVGGVLILRLAGRKSISQLTVAQTVLMIAIGSLIIEPLGDKNIWVTLLITLLFVVTLIIIEFMTVKSDVLERFVYGRSVIVIQNGAIDEQNLKKLRLTVDMLELRLRQQGIQSISDVQWATIESNGQLGYMLKPEKQYATKQDIQQLMSILQANLPGTAGQNASAQPTGEDNLFTEVQNNGHKHEPPDKLK
jgi:uncharacterized membrane protein YcaP (DUF421 family)